MEQRRQTWNSGGCQFSDVGGRIRQPCAAHTARQVGGLAGPATGVERHRAADRRCRQARLTARPTTTKRSSDDDSSEMPMLRRLPGLPPS